MVTTQADTATASIGTVRETGASSVSSVVLEDFLGIVGMSC